MLRLSHLSAVTIQQQRLDVVCVAFQLHQFCTRPGIPHSQNLAGEQRWGYKSRKFISLRVNPKQSKHQCAGNGEKITNYNKYHTINSTDLKPLTQCYADHARSLESNSIVQFRMKVRKK